MKKTIQLFSLSLLLISFNGKGFSQTSDKVKTILDSLEVLKSVGGIVDSYSPNSSAKKLRYFQLTKMLFSLPLTETRKLLSDENKFARVYGMLVLTKRYFDSIQPGDLQILKDTNSLPIHTPKGNVNMGLTVGMYAEMMYASTRKEQVTLSKKDTINTLVKQFILAHAKYPKSYLSIGFSGFTFGGSDENIYYELVHSYSLKNREGKRVDIKHYFILNNEFEIILIEKIRSGIFNSNPPKTNKWLEEFGEKE